MEALAYAWRPGDVAVTVAAADLRAVELAVLPGLGLAFSAPSRPPTPGVAWPLVGAVPPLRPHIVAAAGCTTLGRAGVHMLNYLRDVADGAGPPLVTVVLRPPAAAPPGGTVLRDGVVLAPHAAAPPSGGGGGGSNSSSSTVTLLGTLGKRDGEGRRHSPKHALAGFCGSCGWSQALFALRGSSSGGGGGGGTLERYRLNEAREAVVAAGGSSDDAHALRAWLEGSGSSGPVVIAARPAPRWSLPLDSVARVHLSEEEKGAAWRDSGGGSEAAAPMLLTLTLTDGTHRHLLAGSASAAWAWAGSLAAAAGLTLTPAARARVLVEAAVRPPRPSSGGASGGTSSKPEGTSSAAQATSASAAAAAADLGALCASLQDGDVRDLVARAMADEEAARREEAGAMACQDAASDAGEHAALAGWEADARCGRRVLDLDALEELAVQRARHGAVGRYREAAALPLPAAAAAAAAEEEEAW
jgi:hypothetical protein